MFYSKLRLLSIVFSVFTFGASAFAQRDNSLPGTSLEINGQVRVADQGAQGGVPVESILVRIERFGGGTVGETIANSSGRFRFSSLAPGHYIIFARASGFVSNREQVELDPRILRRAQVFLSLVPETSTARRSNSRDTSALFDARIPTAAQREWARAQRELSDGRIDRAIQYSERALSIYPNFYEAHLLLGTVFMNAREWVRAENSLRRAVEINPNATAPLVSLGEVYRRQRRYTDAERTLKDAIRIDENLWQAHFTLGRVYLETNDPVKAGYHVARTLQVVPDLAEAHLLAGNIFLQLGRRDNAIIEYEEYLRLAPRGEFSAQTTELLRRLRRAPSIREN